MKKIFITVLLLIFSNLAFPVWYGSPTNFTSGTYANVQWGTTITIAANQNVIFTVAQFSSGALIIRSGATLTISQTNFQGNGSITLEPGATLNLNGTFNANRATVINNNGGIINVNGSINHSNSTFTVNDGGVVNVTGTMLTSGGLNIERYGRLIASTITLNGTNRFGGYVEATNTMNINGGNNIFDECSQAKVNTMSTSNGNVISGRGFVQIVSTYNNQGTNGGWAGHPLTSSSNIVVNYTGSATTKSFGSATMTNSTNNPCFTILPYVFNTFSANSSINGILNINWNALETAETDYYEVQVSTDGIHFETVERIYSEEKIGNKTYQYKLKF